MSLKQWVDNGWLRPHKTSAEEIEILFAKKGVCFGIKVANQNS